MGDSTLNSTPKRARDGAGARPRVLSVAVVLLVAALAPWAARADAGELRFGGSLGVGLGIDPTSPQAQRANDRDQNSDHARTYYGQLRAGVAADFGLSDVFFLRTDLAATYDLGTRDGVDTAVRSDANGNPTASSGPSRWGGGVRTFAMAALDVLAWVPEVGLGAGLGWHVGQLAPLANATLGVRRYLSLDWALGLSTVAEVRVPAGEWTFLATIQLWRGL